MSKRVSLPIILLAAGQSRRMRGRDKLLEVIDGVPLLRLQTEKACAATSGQILVALPPAPHLRYEALEGLNVTTVAVPDAKEGMNASLRASFAALPKGCSHAMVLLADLPDLTVADLTKVAQAVSDHPQGKVWRGATQDGAPGHPIIFHHDLFSAFATLQGDTGGKEIITQAKGQIHLVPLPNTHARLDLDTPEAWEKWRRERQK